MKKQYPDQNPEQKQHLKFKVLIKINTNTDALQDGILFNFKQH